MALLNPNLCFRKSMKTPRWFTRNRFLSHLRLGTAVTLMSAAGAMAFVAIAPTSLSLAKKSVVDEDAFSRFSKFRQDRDDLLSSKLALPGVERDGVPLLAAEQDYANRAYPATDIPFSATLNAQKAFNSAQARSNPKSNIGIWKLIGPSTGNVPDILTFTGAATTYSGRITALAIDPGCTVSSCRLWVAAAGGGIWRTDNALSGSPTWSFVSSSFGTNAIGTLTYDAAHTTLYAGTGEPNASGDSEAGLGLYKSTDGGTTWTHLASMVTSLTTSSCGASNATGACVLPVSNGTYTGDAFAGRSISSIVPDPNNASVLYVSSTRGVRGISSVTGGATSNPPTPRPPFGLFKSTDGGATFTFIWDGNSSVRGVNHVERDPNYLTNSTLYAAGFQQGVWRSADGGSSWTQIFTATSLPENTDRSEFAVTFTNSHTRMYVGDGSTGATAPSQFFRSDEVEDGTPTFKLLSDPDRNNPYYATYNYCTGQCWYDNFVVTPAGYPDVVYLGGSFQYSFYGLRSNGQAVLYSTNAGEHFYDMTWDSTTNPLPAGGCCATGNTTAANGIHPDQHALVVAPTNPGLFFEGSDGGLVRSDGTFTDISSQCDSRGLSAPSKVACHNMLAQVPTTLSTALNAGLSTLQFQSVSYNPFDPLHSLQGGTQDNGTWSYTGSTTWNEEIYGDGGQSGFNISNSAIRFNSFFGQYHDGNFQNGDPSKWVILSGPIVSSSEASNFYAPLIADPNTTVAGTIFEGSQSVWRTQDWGGNQAYLETNCPEFTTSGADPSCGDFVQIGPAGDTDLTATSNGGTSRAGGFIAALARTKSDTGTLWVATNTGRVFISKNANAAAGSVTYTRLDTLPSATADPGRFVSSIYIDPSNSNHAWISYSGYNFNTPSQPGHVFSVTYNPTANAGARDATWTNLDGGTGPMGDLPVTALVRTTRGDLYAGTDFGVLRLASGSSSWTVGGTGLPAVEVAGLTLVNGSQVLYAATHGRSVWSLKIP
jgi:hypothetical protein